MPTNNQFAHHKYSDGEPAASYEWLEVPPQPRSGSAEYVERMRRAGRSMRDANVGAIVLVHGTFSGDDPTGLNAMLLGGARDTYRRVCRLTKRAMDAACRDIGNYPWQYAEHLQSALSSDGGIPVHRFTWSGMNNHVGRAVAAVQLAGFLNGLSIEDRPSCRRLQF